MTAMMDADWQMVDYVKEGFTLGKAFDAAGEVGICLAAADNVLSETGYDMPRVEVIEGADEGAVRRCKFQYHHPATWLQHTKHLIQALFQMYEVADTEGAGDSVEGSIREWELLCVPLQ